MRIAWVVLVALAIGLTIFGWTLSYRATLGTCEGQFCDEVDLSWGSEFRSLGTTIGLLPAASLAAAIGIEILSVLPYLVVGFILFSRKSPDRLVWLGAFIVWAAFDGVEAYPSGRSSSLKADKALRAELQKGRVVSKGNQQGLWVPLHVRRMRTHDVVCVFDLGPRKDTSGFSSDDKKALGNLGAEIGASIYGAAAREGN